VANKAKTRAADHILSASQDTSCSPEDLLLNSVTQRYQLMKSLDEGCELVT